MAQMKSRWELYFTVCKYLWGKDWERCSRMKDKRFQWTDPISGEMFPTKVAYKIQTARDGEVR